MTPNQYNQMIAEARSRSEPYRQLRKALADVRLVGGLFVLLGLLPMAAVVFSMGRGDTMGARLMSVVNAIVLLGPGVWYFAAATIMRRLNRQVLRQTVWIARAQLVLVPTMILVGIFARPVGYSPEIFILPAALTVFFVPALIALLFTFRRIGRLMSQVEPEGHAFEALPAQVLPMPQEPPPIQPPPPLPLIALPQQPTQSREG